MSVLSFADRGPWGNAKWRGNCSGHIYRTLFEQLHPASFVDPMVGSGTSVEVALEMGIEAWGLDLHSGFNVLRDSIIGVVGRPVDACISHPPYGDMIHYSGHVWGNEAHPDDLSRCQDDDEFLQRLQLALLNQREAVIPGGIYGMIIGDHRRRGRYTSYQAEMISKMPQSELRAIMIKMQHHVLSGSRSYQPMRFPRIQHEYIVLWERERNAALLVSLEGLAFRHQRAIRSIWVNTVRLAMMELGGRACLPDLYERVSRQATEATLTRNRHWKAKVRQVLQLYPQVFTHSDRGVWALAA